MAGIFDFLGNLNPEQSNALLTFGSGLLQAGGPSLRPTSLGQAFGGALQQAQAALAEAEQRKLQRQAAQQQAQLLGLKIRDSESDFANQERQRAEAAKVQEVLGSLYKPSPSSMAPTVANAQAMTQQQQEVADEYTRLMSESQALRAAGLHGAANQKALEALKFQPEYSTTPQTGRRPTGETFQYVMDKLGRQKVIADTLPRDKFENINGVWSNPFAQKEGGITPQDPNQPFFQGPSGIVPNVAYQQYRERTARASAPNVSVNTATKPFLSEIGKGAGESVVTAFQGAQSAIGTLQNVDQIRRGLGGAILGPGANARVTLAQIGETLGVTGRDTAEQLQNTRNVVQGLARQELSAAGQMKGQGQITESERAILRRAESGLINEMTAPEVKTLLGALERSANYRIGLHQSNMERLSKDPNAKGIVDYMQVNVPSTPPAESGEKFISLSDIAETARRSGRTTQEVTEAAIAKGYKIRGK